jgi:hypothetical protein
MQKAVDDIWTEDDSKYVDLKTTAYFGKEGDSKFMELKMKTNLGTEGDANLGS